MTGDKGLVGHETCCPASLCEAESRASDWLPVTSHSWLPFSPDEHLLYLSSPFTIATRHNRKKTSGAVPSTPGSGFLTAPSTKRPLHVYSVGFPTRVIALGGADFVFCFICCLHGAAIEVTNSHIIAALGSNYLKTNSFPESSSLFSLHSALSFQKIISGGKKFKLLIVPPAPLSGDYVAYLDGFTEVLCLPILQGLFHSKPEFINIFKRQMPFRINFFAFHAFV